MFDLNFFNRLNYKFLLKFFLSIIVFAKSAHFITFRDIQKLGWYKVHLMYLNYLIWRSKRYSWGSACLAILYREMCTTTNRCAKTMSGCALFLQSWAWFQMPFIAPISRVRSTFLVVCQWSRSSTGLQECLPQWFSQIPHKDRPHIAEPGNILHTYSEFENLNKW